MAKLVLADVANILGNPTSAANTINSNSQAIEAALEKTLSRDGTTPNQMTADFDMNNNDILNVDLIDAEEFMLRGQILTPEDVSTLPDRVMVKEVYDPQGKLSDAFLSSNHDFLQSGTGALERSVQNKLREYVSVTDFGVVGDGSDETSKIQSALNTGKSVYFPKPSVAYQATGLTVSTQGQWIFGDGYQSRINCPTGVLFRVTASNVKISDLKMVGGYVSGNQAIFLDGAAQVRIDGCDIREFDVFVRWDNNGFHSYMTNCHTRNARTFGVQLDNGVGFFMSRVTYDTDLGTFSEPTAYIRMRNEGNVVSDCDFIHPGRGVLVDPVSRNVEWCLFNNVFIADSGSLGGNSAGIHINQTSNTFYIRGLFFDHVWSATNNIGVLIEGTGTADVDGLTFKDCMIHNNRNEAVRIDFAAKGISFKDCEFSGNNAFGGSANNLYANKVNGLQVSDCFFGRKYRWTSTPLYHVFIDSLATNVAIDNCEIDSFVTNGKFQILNGNNTTISYARWTPLRTVTISGSNANINVSDNSLGCFSEVMVSFDNIAHDASGDLNLSFSNDGGSTFINTSFERLQFTTGAEGYSTTVSGARTIASGTNIQGSYTLDNPNGAYKPLSYNSGLNAASGQGLMLMGTVNSLIPINYLRFAWSSGNLTGGNIRVFVR